MCVQIARRARRTSSADFLNLAYLFAVAMVTIQLWIQMLSFALLWHTRPFNWTDRHIGEICNMYNVPNETPECRWLVMFVIIVNVSFRIYTVRVHTRNKSIPSNFSNNLQLIENHRRKVRIDVFFMLIPNQSTWSWRRHWRGVETLPKVIGEELNW